MPKTLSEKSYGFGTARTSPRPFCLLRRHFPYQGNNPSHKGRGKCFFLGSHSGRAVRRTERAKASLFLRERDRACTVVGVIYSFQLFRRFSIPTFIIQKKSLNLTFLSARRRGVSFSTARKKPKCRSGGKRGLPLFLPTPTITPHFSDVFIRLHRHTPAVCTRFFTISVYTDLCSLFQPVCLRLSFVSLI